MGVAGEFEKLHAFFQIGFVGRFEPFNLAKATILFRPPLVRHLIEECRIDDAVELVDIHGVNAILKPLVFGLMALDGLLLFPPLDGVAGVKRITYPFQHLVVEVQPAQEFGELLLDHLLAHILAPAGGRVALALIGVAGAVIIDVTFLLDFAHHCTAAGMASDQPGEGKVACHAAVLLRQPAVHHVLHPLPEFDRNDRLVAALKELAVPLELSAVEPVAQDNF